ncbi:alpha/beta hydrolase [Rhodococcus sp. ACPA1]|nr:alpha/beta hydrolase [Rhodococcus sp. ACPA1]
MTPTKPAGGPTSFVLVHGAYHGGWCWSRVRDLLQDRGHRVYTPSQTGCGDRAHLLDERITIDTFVEDITALILAEELHHVVLVGHSFGTRTVVGVADRIPNQLSHLVFLDGGFPTPGQSRLEVMTPAQREARIKSAQESSGGISIPPPAPEAFGLSAPDDIAWVQRRLTPQPFGADTSPQKLSHEIGNGLPCTYVRCIEPEFDGVGTAAHYAQQRQDWSYLTITGGHDAMVSNPRAVANLLESLA